MTIVDPGALTHAQKSTRVITRVIATAAVATFVACGGSSTADGGSGATAGGGSAGTGGTVQTGGSPGTGGTVQTGGTAGSGATAGAGGYGGSAGFVDIEFKIDNGKSYCRQTDGCDFGASSITIKDATGKAIKRYAGFCYVPCDTCIEQPCPGIACMPPHGVAVTGELASWNGTYFKTATCGSATSCEANLNVKPGKFTAVMCATPGDLVDDPTSQQKQCKPSGPQECVEVSFQLPTSQKVIGSLP